jgi:integrase
MALKVVEKKGSRYLYVRGTVNGRRYDESTETANPELAEAYRVKREYELQLEAIHGKAATATFAQACLHYLEHGGSKRFMKPVLQHFGATLLSKIGQEQIDACARALLPRAGPATRNRQVYTPISVVLHHAAGLGWCNKPVIRRPKQPKGRVRWITKAEADRLIDAMSPHMKPLVIFLLYTGARVSEALWLDWSCVDIDNRQQVDFIATKNGTSRGVPLHPRVIEALRSIRLDQNGLRRVGAVFLTDDGKPYTRPSRSDDTSAGSRIKTAFRAGCRRAGISDFRPHDCRHTWATWHYHANRDLGALQRLGGWLTLAMVMRYAHTNVEELADTIERIA